MRILRFCFPAVCFFALLGVVSPPATLPKPERTPVLSGNAIPLSYDLTIEPEHWTWNGGTANGEERIEITLKHASRAVTLNAIGSIRIQQASIDGVDAQTTKYPIAQQMSFRTMTPLAAGHHTLYLRFIGKIFADAAGLWPDGSQHNPNLVSLFEPSLARTLFPCFDEPRYRAAFTVHIIAPSAWTVVSNMPLVSKVALPTNSRKSRFSFAPTPKLPTYLLTLDMGDFVVVRGQSGATPVSVFIRPGQESLAHSVLTKAEASLQYYTHLFGVAYPFPKLDIVVASGSLNDVSSGPGAITVYTEFEVNNRQFSGGLRGHQYTFNIISSSIAQQWFGALVGIDSWSESWLTSSVASWAEAGAQAKLHPAFAAYPRDIDWQWNAISLWGTFAPLRDIYDDDRDDATFNSDVAGGTNAGEAVLHQWAGYVGHSAMRAAVHRFLVQHSRTATNAAAFWDSFGTPLAKHYGNAWLNLPGAPVVMAKRICRDGHQVLSVYQKRIHDDEFHDRRSAIWPIPISVTVDGKTSWTMLGEKSASIPAGVCGQTALIDSGLRPAYLVHLTYSQLASLKHLTTLAPIDRIRVMRDTLTLYTGKVATLPELISAINIGLQAPKPDAFAVSLRFQLYKIMPLLAGSRFSKRFSSDINAAILPLLIAHGFSLTHRTDHLSSIYDVMSYVPNSAASHIALASWRKHRADRKPTFYIEWGLVHYAATAGTPLDFSWALKHTSRASSMLGANDPEIFLEGARKSVVIFHIFDVLGKQHVNYPDIVTAIGARHPHIVAAYILSHATAIMRSAPPTQQAWTLTDTITNGAWAGQSPAQWHAFLARTLPSRDADAIHDAMLIINTKWNERKALEAQLAVTL